MEKRRPRATHMEKRRVVARITSFSSRELKDVIRAAAQHNSLEESPLKNYRPLYSPIAVQITTRCRSVDESGICFSSINKWGECRDSIFPLLSQEVAFDIAWQATDPDVVDGM